MVGVNLFSQVVTEQEEMVSSCPKGGLDWILGNFFSPEELLSLEPV